jgi:hypothetical protein
MGNQNRIIFIPMRLKDVLKESELKGYLAADVVDDIVKSIGSKFVSGEIKNAPNRNYIYLKLTDIKFGSGVVKMLKSQFGIDAKIDKTFGNIPSVSFASNKVVSESVNEEKVYIDFLNKAKGFKQDRIKFNSYEEAVKWARQNFDKFSPDMIKYESVNEGTTKKDIEKLTSYKDLFKFFKDNKSKLNKKYTNDIEDEIGALKYLESDYKRGDADREEVLIAVEEIQDLIKKSLDIKESVNEGKYYVGYNKGRGQGIGVFKDVFSTYKDAKKEVEKIEKQRGGSYNQIAYYVADEKGNFVREAMLGEGREVKAIQSDFNKTVAAIETELLHYKKTKGTPQEKKHIDNLKKLHPIKKKLEAELESAVSGLYRDAELKIED